MADAKSETKARNGKPRDVAAMKQKQAAQERDVPVPSRAPTRAPSGEVVPVPQAAPARQQSGGGFGDYLDMIMGAAFPGQTQRSFGDNAPSTMTPEDIAAMQAEEEANAQAQFAREQSLNDYVEPGTGLATKGGDENTPIDAKTAAEIDAMAAEGWSNGEIAAALGGVVGAGALATYLGTRGKKGKGPDMIDEVMDATDTDAQKAARRGESSGIDKTIQDRVEGRDNTARPGPNRVKQGMQAGGHGTAIGAPAMSDVDMTIDQTMGDNLSDRAAAMEVESGTGMRTAPNRFSGQTQGAGDIDAIIDQAASLNGRAGAELLRQHGIELSDDVLRRIVERQAGRAAGQAVR